MTADATYTATFTATPIPPVDDTYTISTNITAGNGEATTDKGTAKAGEQVTVTVAPAEGYGFIDVDVSVMHGEDPVDRTVEGNTVTFTMPAGNVTVFVGFRQIVTVTVAPIDDQTFTEKPVEPELTVTAKDAAGNPVEPFVKGTDYEVTYYDNVAVGEAQVIVYERGNYLFANDPDTTFNIVRPVGTVKVAVTTVNLVNANGEVTVAPETEVYPGDKVTTITPAEGFDVDVVTIECKDAEGKVLRTVTSEENSDILDEDIFTGTYSVIAPIAPEGCTEIVVSATYDVFYDIRVDLDNMDFTNGYIELGFYPYRAKVGDTVTVTPKPKDGYRVKSVTWKDAGDDNKFLATGISYTLEEGITGPIVVSAEFEPIPAPSGGGGGGGGGVTYTVTANTPENGKVTVSPTSARTGSTVTVTPTPDEGYKVDKVTATDSKGNAITVTEKDGKYTFTVPANSGNIKVDASFVLIGEEPDPGPGPEPAGFTDVPDDAWFAPAVQWAVDQGITKGTSDTTFSPNMDLSRGMAVTFLWRMMGEPTPTGINPFEDVTTDDYFFNPVVWAVDTGVTKGTSETTFSPNDTVTRGQLVTFIYRLAGEPEVTQANPFSDVDSDAYYYNAVVWAAEAGLVQGYPDGSFQPNKSITRAELVTVLYNGVSAINAEA